jgi:formamidopyrimidine-DNA glycosylase
MPELPEVETIRAGLNQLLPGKKVAAVWHDWAKGFPNTPEDVQNFLIGSKVREVRRRAKVLLIDLSSEYTLIVHLKMTGQMVFRSKSKRWGAGHPNDSLVSDLPDKSTRVIIDFDDDSKLYFNDQRKFGWVRLLPTVEVPHIDFMKKVGPEPLSNDFTPQIFRERIRRRSNTNIKAAILDQTVVAGIGNIYADESLWGAKIHPQTLVKDVSSQKLNMLYSEIRYILQLSIDKGGSSDRNYVNAEGKKGSYLDFARVFRRQGLACERCSKTIEKIRVAGRGTHLCPHCQKFKPPDAAKHR